MVSLIHLIRNENMKLYKRTGTWVMIGLIILAIVGVGLFSKFVLDSDAQINWKEQLKDENMQLERTMKDTEKMGVGNNYVKQQLAINNYRLENDYPPVHSQSLWGFMIDATNFTGFVALFTIVVAAGIVASEFSWGTIKLLLIRPVSRSKILLSKYITTILFALFMISLLFGLSFIFGSLLFGFSGLEQPNLVYQEGQVVEQNMITYIISLYGFNSIDLFMMLTFAFMISTVFRSSSLAIGISIFLMFTGPQLVQLLSNYEWVKYVLFANTNLQQYTNGIPIVEGMTMTFSVSMIIIYFVIFIALSWIIFEKQDVAS
ncbi:ABC-2 type transport system permease protein [Virgibacillus subterraneus]|uniref:ABC-2 type transport system permease protein n=1 Tax=Virgibacillus subterraneus TaxID=621109 RepID=A0A1H9GCE0_9BACI|nr:ABC transporter permease [Virgibacillus subterraneus]SEQ47762.1 ABC-2 type transport system permease protein [Virgibacillus subterraneus]